MFLVSQIWPPISQIRQMSDSTSQNEQKTDLEKSHICHTWGQSDPLFSRTWQPWPISCVTITYSLYPQAIYTLYTWRWQDLVYGTLPNVQLQKSTTTKQNTYTVVLWPENHTKTTSREHNIIHTPWNRDGKFDIQIGSDWPQIEQIWDFLRSVSIHFGMYWNWSETDLKKSQICPICGQSDPIWIPNLKPL